MSSAASPMMADLADLMQAKVTVQSYVANNDPYSKNDTLNPKINTYAARVNTQNHYVRDAQGELVVATGTIWIATADKITVSDKITLPDGSSPIILRIDQESDEAGLTVYTRIEFG